MKYLFPKFLICSVVLCMIFSLCGCGNSNSEDSFEQTQTSKSSDFSEVSTRNTSNDVEDSVIEDSKPSESTKLEDISKEEYEDPEYTQGKIIASGECGDKGNNVTWKLDEYNLLVISGSGNMKDYSYDTIKGDCDAPWYRIKEKIISVIIGKGVTSIGDSAFAGCDSLTSITIPDNVTSIGENGFNNTSIKNIIIPNTVTNIGNGAFSHCTSLKSIIIPYSVSHIGDYVLENCTELTNIIVEKNNKNYSSLDGVLFDKDKSTLICCPASMTGTYTVPDTVTNIGTSAFYNCGSLSSITLPNSITSIGTSAFYNCYSLSSITIPNNVTIIGNFAFHSCTSLNSITIPKDVKSVGDFAFNNWTYSQTIYIKGKSSTPSEWSDQWNWFCHANIVWDA